MSFFKLLFRFWQKIINGLFFALLAVLLALIYFLLVVPLRLGVGLKRAYKEGWVDGEKVILKEKLY